jgi:hypothetical protein
MLPVEIEKFVAVKFQRIFSLPKRKDGRVFRFLELTRPADVRFIRE